MKIYLSLFVVMVAVLPHFIYGQTNVCQCGVFVGAMFPGLSNLEPLQYVEEDGEAESCNLVECQQHCAQESQDFNFDLTMDYPGTNTTTGQVYCERYAELFPSGAISDERQVVRSRTPEDDCSFVLWGTTNVHESDITLCCDSGTWCPLLQ